jgi:hypothetical protein
MTAFPGMSALRRDDVVELAPLLRRTVTLDASGLARLRRTGEQISALVRLPFAVLAARTVLLAEAADDLDTTVRSAELLAWLDGEADEPPTARDSEWRSGVPPTSGWQRIDRVPDTELRALVRSGALALKQAAERDGLPGAQPRAEVADALLDSVVLTVTDGPRSAQINLRTLSAVTRLGFLPRDSYVAVDVAGRWLRLAAAYGSVYAERPGLTLTLR